MKYLLVSEKTMMVSQNDNIFWKIVTVEVV